MTSSPQVTTCAYVVASSLIVIPVIDVAISQVPFHPGSIAWRVGALEMLSGSLMLSVLGVLIAVVTAVATDQLRLQRAIRRGTWAVAGLLTVAIAALSLDAVHARASVQPQLRAVFVLTSVAALAKLALDAVTLVLLGRACRSSHRVRTPSSAMAIPLMRRDVPGHSRFGL